MSYGMFDIKNRIFRKRGIKLIKMQKYIFRIAFVVVMILAPIKVWGFPASGSGELHDGVWYVLYSTGEESFSTISSKEYTLSGPGAQLTYDAKCEPIKIIIEYWGGDLKAAQYVNGAWSAALFSQTPPKNRYQSYGPVAIDAAAEKIKLYTETGATGYKYFKNVKVTMASYTKAPMHAELDFGTGVNVAEDSVVRWTTVDWCNTSALSYSLPAGTQYSVSITNNAQAGQYGVATVTITYDPSAAGTHNETLTLTGANGYSQTISLTGTATEEEGLACPVFAGDYVFRNRATGRYMAGGNKWGTQASLSNHGVFFGMTQQGDGSYYIDSHVYQDDLHYLGSNLYLDAAAQSWNVRRAGDYYLLSMDGTHYLGSDASTLLNVDGTDASSANVQWEILSREELITELAAATADTPQDATFLISNQNFARNDRHAGWTADGSNIQLANGSNNEARSQYYCATSNNSTFSVVQSLENIPNGRYQLRVQGFYHQNGSDNDNLPYFFANNRESTLMLHGGSESTADQAGEAFFNGSYQNAWMDVIVTNESMVIGAANEHNTNLWVAMDNFELRYLGTQYETIVWSQAFRGLDEDHLGAEVALTAYVVDQDWVTIPHAITYSSSNSSVVEIVGDRLIVRGGGTAKIHAVSDNGLTEDREVRVRRNGEPCATTVVEAPMEKSIFTIGSTEPYVLSGPGKHLSFEAKHTFLAMDHFFVQYTTDNSIWQDLFNEELKLSTSYKTYEYDLPEGTKAIRFTSKTGGTLTKYVRNVKVTQTSYLNVDGLASKDIAAPTVYCYESIHPEFQVNFSDVPNLQITQTNNDFTYAIYDQHDALLSDFDNDCGDYGYFTIRVTYTPKTRGAYSNTVTIFNGNGEEAVVRITGTANGYVYETDGSWTTSDNWNVGNKPTTSVGAFVEADVVLTTEETVAALIVAEGKTLTIAPTGGLTVGAGGVINHGTIVLQAATTGAQAGQTGYLKVSPLSSEPMPQAEVQLFAKSYFSDVARWQYIGSPVTAETVEDAQNILYKCYLYGWDETQNGSSVWASTGNYYKMIPFAGYATTQKYWPEGHMAVFQGQLNPTNGVVQAPLSYTDNGIDNDDRGFCLLANSWTAPIDISKFAASDFPANAEQQIYIYNAGGAADRGVSGEQFGTGAGQYTTVPIGSACLLSGYPTTIPAMQGFFVRTIGNVSAHPYLTMDYSRLVWAGTQANEALHAPVRLEEEPQDTLQDSIPELTHRVAICLQGEDGSRDVVYLLEREDFSPAYDNGFDGRKILVDGLTSIYTSEPDGEMAISATNDVQGMQLGFSAGEASQYTLTFADVVGDGLQLRDLQTGAVVPVREGEQYAFVALPQTAAASRFRVEAAEEEAGVATSVEELQAVMQQECTIYDAGGRLVGTSAVGLPSGVYIVRQGNLVLKMVR